jgi:hypothetical protein
MVDYLVLPGERLVHPYTLTNLWVNHAGWIGRYRLTQEALDRLALEVVPTREPEPAELSALCAGVADRLGPGVEFRVEVVREIRPEASGKVRIARSLVRSRYDRVDWSRVLATPMPDPP